MEAEPYAWAEDNNRFPSLCLTIARSMSISEMLDGLRLRRLPTEVSPPGSGPVGEARRIWLPSLGEWQGCLETIELVGFQPEVMSRLAAREALCVLKGGDGLRTVAHYVEGRRAETFEISGRPVVYGPGPHQLSAAYLAAVAQREPTTTYLATALDLVGRYIGAILDAASVLDSPQAMVTDAT